MKLILYTKSNNVGRRIRQIVNDIISDGQIEIFPELEDFSMRLRRVVDNVTVLVMVASTFIELETILQNGEIVREIRSILILPDRTPETVAKGHTLYPRFVSYTDSDFKGFEAVLRKMSQQLAERDNDLLRGEIPVETNPKPSGNGSEFSANITDG